MKEYVKWNNGRRLYRRYMVDGIHGNVLKMASLEIINISMDGAALETTRRLELNREYAFRIQHHDVNLSLRGRVVWAILISKESKDNHAFTPVYRVGVRFIDKLGENVDIFLKFIEDSKIKALTNRLGGVGVKIAGVENIKVDYQYRHEVKRLSLSGMLIETQYPLAPGSHHPIELVLNGHQLNIAGRIARCNSRNPNRISQYDVGVDFMEITDDDKSLLKNFLRSLKNEIGLVLFFLFVLNYKS